MATLGASQVGRAAVSKASWRLLPLIGLGYGIAYMDRVNISFASLQMNQDLHFQRHGLWSRRRPVLSQLRLARSAFEPPPGPVRPAPLDRAHHVDVGPAGS